VTRRSARQVFKLDSSFTLPWDAPGRPCILLVFFFLSQGIDVKNGELSWQRVFELLLNGILDNQCMQQLLTIGPIIGSRNLECKGLGKRN